MKDRGGGFPPSAALFLRGKSGRRSPKSPRGTQNAAVANKLIGISAVQSSRMRAETLRRSRPPLSRGQLRRSVSTARDRQALGFAALGRASAFPLRAPSCSRPISRSVGEPLADDAAERPVGALYIVNAECDALVVPEVELGEVALQVLFVDVVIYADDSALQDREIAFNGVGVRVAA